MKPQKSKTKGVTSYGVFEACLPGIGYMCENDELYTMRFITPTLRELMGYNPEDFIHNRKHFAASVIVPDDLDVVDEFAETIVSTGLLMAARYRLVRANGEIFPALVFARSVVDPKTKQSKGFCGIALDLSNTPALQGKSEILTQLPKVKAPRKAAAKRR